MDIVIIQNKCVVQDKDPFEKQRTEYIKEQLQLQLQQHDFVSLTNEDENQIIQDDGELICLSTRIFNPLIEEENEE